ncbi:glycoside hydrolase family 2 [Massilia sp. BJB1822]|uniref:glycoside hydrolase family 2 n=1 Tax=Massilia sp. BJB1822 TaxID=2744470 RepID=UPI0015934DDB|nr:glycoside hydrolase family 2 [Massilia sp. BJB1822]NVE01783.1 glycoside hydrolase family 2 [Massilia sp. BJB1822]
MHAAHAATELVLARAEMPLNGPWAFRFGNDARWALPAFDDRDWERVDLTPAPGAHDGDVGLPGYVPGWTSRGHSGQWGHAWYRLRIRWTMPEGSAPVLIGPTLVDSAYEVYWSGRKIGGIGTFSETPPRVFGIRPQLIPLGETASAGEGVLAIHVYLPRESVNDTEAGGIHVAPILAEPTAAAARYQVQWWQTFWGYVVDLLEPLALLALALFALALRRFARKEPFLLLAAGAVSAIAASRLNQPLFYWTEAESLQAIIVARYVVLNPLAIVLWLLAGYRLAGVRERRLDIATGLLGMAAGLAALPGFEFPLIQTGARAILLLLFCLSCVGIVRYGRLRLLALPTTLIMGVALFPGELSALGLPGIWFPFGVGVSRTQYALALEIPLLAWFMYQHASTIAAATSAGQLGAPPRRGS